MSTIADRKEDRRHAVRRRDVASVLRGEIISGVYPPGALFPIRADLQQRFATTPVTIQHAVDQLRREGFVYTAGRRATYVSPYPPHLYCYAMVFSTPRLPEEAPGGSRFFRALVNSTAAYDGTGQEPRRIVVHYGIDFNHENHDARMLLQAARAHCYAGLIFPEHPYVTGMAETPLARIPDLPCVAIMPRETGPISAVSTEGGSFLTKAMDYLSSRGRRRLAVLSNTSDPGLLGAILADAGRRGMVCRPYWTQMVRMESPEFARNVTHLLFHAGQAERPDALFITDDNLVEHAIGGIIDAGVRVPEDLEVVAHCNFPWPAPSVLPVKRLGYDARDVLAALLESIEAQRQGATVTHRDIPAMFEEELKPAANGNGFRIAV